MSNPTPSNPTPSPSFTFQPAVLVVGDISLAELEADIQRNTATLYAIGRVVGLDHAEASGWANSVGADYQQFNYSIDDL